MANFIVRLENQRKVLITEAKQNALNCATAALRTLEEAGYQQGRAIGYPIHQGPHYTSYLYRCRKAGGNIRDVTVRVIELVEEEERFKRASKEADDYFARHGRMP